MADKKISQLTAASTPLAGTEVLPIVQSGTTVKATIANIVGAGTSPGSFTTSTASAGMFAPFAFAGNANNSFNAYATNAAINYGAVFTGGLDGGGVPYAQISVWNNAKVDVATLRSTGDMTLNVGNLVIGTSGKGIDFSITSHPAGMTSELLADYEEGTWTPSQGAGLTVVGTFSSSGTYTKVGRMVTLRAYVSGSTSVALATTNTVLCGNIPFTPTTQTTDRYVGGMLDQTFTSFGAVSALGSFTTIYNIGTLAAVTYIHFTVVYFV